MKKVFGLFIKYVCFCYLLFQSNFFIGQTTISEPKTPFKEKIFWGGNFGLQFGNLTIIEVSPTVGYRVNDAFLLGSGVIYQYYRFKDTTFEYKTSIYGGNIFTQHQIFDNLYAHGEYQLLNLEVYSVTSNLPSRVWTPVLFLGGGYRTQLGRRSFAYFSVLFDIIENQNSPYQNPYIRISFGF